MDSIFKVDMLLEFFYYKIFAASQYSTIKFLIELFLSFFHIFVMSLRFTRCLHYKRVPNYHGFWTEILHSAKPTPRKTLTVEQVPVVKRIPIAIPFEPVIEEITTIPKVKTVVYLKGNPIQLPTKPESPDNCCMR